MRRATYRQIVKTSIHETLTRSMITSLTTLLPLIVLYFFGGDTLKTSPSPDRRHPAGGIRRSRSRSIAALWKERETRVPQSVRPRPSAGPCRASRPSADVVDLDALERAEAGLEAELALEEENLRRSAAGGRRRDR